MESANGVTTMISATTVEGVGEQHILVFVITNPLAAAFGPGQVCDGTTQPAFGAC